ncbi:MAG: imidazole glycerol phosphate synthase subunit HisH [Phycisphaerae bacterium]
MLAIVDYGMANLRSVQKAFERLGHSAEIISTPEQVRAAGHLVVPGVGAFCDAIAVLEKSGLADAIRDHVKAGKPMLGICLGLQLLADVGHEDGTHKGLGIIPGEVVRFTVDQPPYRLKVPHMGWNALKYPAPEPGVLFQNLPKNPYVYFVHSYHLVPKDPGVIAAVAEYGQPFVAAITKGNVMATQFHPEKSQEVGAQILKNFARYKC